jgi:hypothetical protein
MNGEPVTDVLEARSEVGPMVGPSRNLDYVVSISFHFHVQRCPFWSILGLGIAALHVSFRDLNHFGMLIGLAKKLNYMLYNEDLVAFF